MRLSNNFTGDTPREIPSNDRHWAGQQALRARFI